MINDYVGAGILNIITESLYDNPIVVFREYVQNSMDSIFRETDRSGFEIKIWSTDNNLYFLDNGRGIKENTFFDEMKKIGGSNKRKQKNMGYKGIGRLSGVPYCKKLLFANIVDYQKQKYQLYTIDGAKYDEIKNTHQDSALSFLELMNIIGENCSEVNLGNTNYSIVNNAINKYKCLLEKTNSGFLVILQDITSVLKNTINSKDFFTDLQWLLPVNFDADLLESDKKELFNDLLNVEVEGIPAIRFCEIAYNDQQIYRPIKQSMLRDYVCKNNFQYAVGFHTFNGNKIFIDKDNVFSGIKIYIDNMLLCDESELLQSLSNYGLLDHTLNGQLQSVRGIGAIIYITDKISVSSNARRTFIEVSDNDSLDFLKLLAEFINTIYDTRYALSNYASAKTKQDKDAEKLQILRISALNNLRKLAKEDVELTLENDELLFDELSIVEQKRAVKNKIVSQFDKKIKEYLKTIDCYDWENAFTNFIQWLQQNI